MQKFPETTTTTTTAQIIGWTFIRLKKSSACYLKNKKKRSNMHRTPPDTQNQSCLPWPEQKPLFFKSFARQAMLSHNTPKFGTEMSNKCPTLFVWVQIGRLIFEGSVQKCQASIETSTKHVLHFCSDSGRWFFVNICAHHNFPFSLHHNSMSSQNYCFPSNKHNFDRLVHWVF